MPLKHTDTYSLSLSLSLSLSYSLSLSHTIKNSIHTHTTVISLMIFAEEPPSCSDLKRAVVGSGAVINVVVDVYTFAVDVKERGEEVRLYILTHIER